MSNKIDVRLVGKSIRQLRLSRHWTQEYLANAVGYSVRNLRRIETDGTGSIDIVNTFAGIFEVSAIDILEGVSFCLSIIKKSWWSSPYITYSNLLFVHVHARLSKRERPSNFWNGLLLAVTTGRARLPSNFQRASAIKK